MNKLNDTHGKRGKKNENDREKEKGKQTSDLASLVTRPHTITCG